MLAPVNGRDWQFITADSHTAERGPGGGTSPHGTPLEEPIPFLPPQASSHGKADTCLQSLQGKKRTQNLTVRAWFKVSAIERGTTCCHSHLRDMGSFSRGCVPRTAPEQLQGGQRGSATGGATAVTPGDLVCLCLEENSPASPAPRDKVGVCCPPPPPASRQGKGGRETGDPEDIPLPEGFLGPGRAVGGPRLGKWYPAGPAASGGDAGLGCGPSTTRTRTAFALVISRGGEARQSFAPRLPGSHLPGAASLPRQPSEEVGEFPGRVLRPR